MSEPANTLPVALADAAYERYLAYALSVITARALPDVRDGLKPVQRRILYTMDHELGLAPSGRYRKSAAVVGEVMGKYHPHGDSSIYDALVRMAQSFSLRAPLVDGQGNFGSLDGDPPAAMRYTECRLTPIAIEMLSELDKKTVEHRPSYDGQRSEPVVLPARFPQLLVNGCEGIAVGMATRIPPHALAEVVAATELLMTDPETPISRLVEVLPGPDFPTGGRIVTPQAELTKIYTEGHGSFRLRATWDTEKEGRKRSVIITAIPYGTNKSKLVERIGGLVSDRKLPLVVDVRDESTDDVRIVLELRSDAAPEPVMAYLFRHTDLEVSYSVNLTVLVPSARADVAVPERIDVRRALLMWIDFRDATVRRRLGYDLAELLARIHILEGYAIVIDALDEAIALIRASEGRRDAGERLIRRFRLSDEQADAILELRLYRLAKMELSAILEDLEDKRARAAELERILASSDEIRKLIRHELRELVRLYGDARRTLFGEEALPYDEDAYIVKEDAWVVVTRDGWIKRQISFTALDKIRVRDGDLLGWLARAHTRAIVTLFGDQGSAYATRVDALPATTGYGEPVQRQFSFADGERIVGLVSHDERVRPPFENPPESDDPPGPYAVALTRRGRVLRFPLDAHDEPSTRNGRRFMRLDEGDRVFAVWPAPVGSRLAITTRQGRAVVVPTGDVPILKPTNRTMAALELKPDDDVFAADVTTDPRLGVAVHATNGETYLVSAAAYPKGTLGTPGRMLFRRSAELDGWLDRRPIVQGTVDAEPERANGGVT